MNASKNIASALAQIWNCKRRELPLRNDRDKRCAAIQRSSRVLIAEVAAKAISGILVLAALKLVGCVVWRWMEGGEPGPLNSPAWHEPLDSSSL
jgi:hypothetical protein